MCGLPLLAYPLRTLVASGCCDTIIISTDDESVGQLGIKYGADSFIIREPEWDSYPYFEACVDASIKRYEDISGNTFDDCTYITGNCVFVRPSWIRVAVRILRTMNYNQMPLHSVICEQPFISLGVFQILHGGCGNLNQFLLQHKGILCDIDNQQDFNLACQIKEAINAGHIHYPLEEYVHDNAFAENNPNHFRGLTAKETPIDFDGEYLLQKATGLSCGA